MPASPRSSTFTLSIVYMNGLLFTVEPSYIEPSTERVDLGQRKQTIVRDSGEFEITEFEIVKFYCIFISPNKRDFNLIR